MVNSSQYRQFPAAVMVVSHAFESPVAGLLRLHQHCKGTRNVPILRPAPGQRLAPSSETERTI